MKPIEKALVLRRGTRFRSRQPVQLMRRRLLESQRILALVERSDLPESARREARRQYVVASCAAFESYWREFVRVNVNRHPVSKAPFSELKGLTFSIADVQNVLGRKLTLGELVSCSYSFQGPEALDASLSEILRCKVFSDFAGAHFSIREVPSKRRPKSRPFVKTEVTGREILKRTIPSLQKAYTIRHDTVHNTGAAHRITAREAWVIGNAGWELCTFLGLHLDGKFDEFWTHRRGAAQPNEPLKRMVGRRRPPTA